MSKKIVNRIVNRINVDNIDEAIYTYATVLEKLVDLRKQYDEDEEFLESDSSSSSSDESLIEVSFDLRRTEKSLPENEKPEDYQWKWVEMVEKGEISHHSYKTIGGISPFPTILGVSHPDVVGID